MITIPTAFAQTAPVTGRQQEPDYPEIDPTIAVVVIFFIALGFFLWKKFRK
ncbi:MAG: hypothetical protein KC680_04755 [Candidatus Peregrinibacteria bacterium]|nr:hypothetical protein [Candidatus Peregrinibacteria bacterium]